MMRGTFAVGIAAFAVTAVLAGCQTTQPRQAEYMAPPEFGTRVAEWERALNVQPVSQTLPPLPRQLPVAGQELTYEYQASWAVGGEAIATETVLSVSADGLETEGWQTSPVFSWGGDVRSEQS